LYDRQMHDNGAIVPLQGGGYTVSSPLWIDGAEKAPAVPAPGIGEHSAPSCASTASRPRR
ncbi:MAG TPA: hypothetical protein VF930_01095, partial [Stellaceae bacterium]